MCGSSSSLKVHKRNIHSDDGFVCAEDGCGKKVKTKVGALFVPALRIRISYCCWPCNHYSNWTWVVQEILAFMVIGCVLRTAGISLIWKLCRPIYFTRTTQLLPHLAMSSGRFAYFVIQLNDTTNDNIFHMSGGVQGVYSKMLGVGRILFLVDFRIYASNSKLWSSNKMRIQIQFFIVVEIRICDPRE